MLAGIAGSAHVCKLCRTWTTRNYVDFEFLLSCLRHRLREGELWAHDHLFCIKHSRNDSRVVFQRARVNKSYDSPKGARRNAIREVNLHSACKHIERFPLAADKKAAQSRRERHEKCVRESLSAMLAEKVATCGWKFLLSLLWMSFIQINLRIYFPLPFYLNSRIYFHSRTFSGNRSGIDQKSIVGVAMCVGWRPDNLASVRTTWWRKRQPPQMAAWEWSESGINIPMAAALQILSIISHQVALFDNVADLHLDRLGLMLNIRNEFAMSTNGNDSDCSVCGRLLCKRKICRASIEVRRNFIKNSLNSSKHSTGSNRITNVGATRSGSFSLRSSAAPPTSSLMSLWLVRAAQILSAAEHVRRHLILMLLSVRVVEHANVVECRSSRRFICIIAIRSHFNRCN